MNQVSQLQRNSNIDGYPIQAGLTRRVVEDDARNDAPGEGVSAHPPGRAGLSLGTYAKFGADQISLLPVDQVDDDQPFAVDRASGARLRRYAGQKAARRILPAEEFRRVHDCLMVRHKPVVEVRRNPDDSSTCYGGLVTCGNVWICPICANRISQARREEVQAAVDKWCRAGGTVLMAALTVSHSAAMPLADLLPLFLDALRSLRQQRAFRTWCDELGLAGMLRVIEITWGREHGWHPHAHILFFVEGKYAGDLHELESGLYAAWLQVISRYGLNCDRVHGVKLQEGWSAVAEYLTKWGELPQQKPKWDVGAEMLRGHAKVGRSAGRYTPFDLLRVFDGSGDLDAARLFYEYAQAFRGRHQLQWSRGLRERLDMLEELSDAEIAAGEGDIRYNEVVGVISPAEWQAVRGQDMRGEVLEIARSGDAEELRAFIENIYYGWLDAGRPMRC